MRFLIRNERKEDYRQVEELAREAFWNLYIPGCHEHYVVHQLRFHNDYLKDLSFIIEDKNEIIGAIFFTKAKIICDENKSIDVISFGPVFIDPRFHRKGIGKVLITYAIENARKKGYRAIITLGYPYHYEPYGFLSGKNYNISMEDKKYYKGLLVLPLYENALKDVKGYALFSSVFETNQQEVDEFDKAFEYKEKKYQESQKEYEIACAQIE